MSMWQVVLILAVVLPPTIVLVQGRRYDKINRKERMIKLSKAYIVSIFVELILFIISGVLGFFDYVGRFSGISGTFILFGPALLPIIASTLLLAYYSEKKTMNRKILLLGFVLLLAIVFGMILLFMATEGITNFVIFIIYSIGVAEVFSKLVKKVGKGEVLTGELSEEIRRICRRYGIKIRTIYVLKDDKPYALVSGFGGKDVYVTEGLLEKLDRDEVIAVIAHELGHVKKKHLFKDSIISIVAVALAIIPMNLDLPVWVVIGGVLLSIALIIYDFTVLRLKNEYEADEFAAKIAGKEHIISALKKLAEINEIPKDTPRWFDVMHSHPSIKKRIKRLEEMV
ncbi:M48 family metallopeptidase [Pyrococcus kukulkanii]|uniref:M48 family metallopeptidase n=1 Tax=Pyrococcus kukulkanii TaxID=1609559 RepID=UPI0035627B6F